MMSSSVFMWAPCFGIGSSNGSQLVSSLWTTKMNSKSFEISYSAFRGHNNNYTTSVLWTMKMYSKSSNRREDEKCSLELHDLCVSQLETSSTQSNLQFDRLQLDTEISADNKLEFGQFMAREVLLDEEYWTAAWLRSESHWENRTHERYANNHKRKFAEEEFNALKRRCKAQLGQKCACIVAVRKDDKNVKRTVLKSVVGTLDVSIRPYLPGETFPGERVRASLFCSSDRKIHGTYGYVANLCVAKSARRQGIASNMLLFAIRSAKENGVEQLYVHVHRNNTPAQRLYQKMGFEVVERAGLQLSAEQTFLLCIST